jgi:hypothetical protein
MVYGLALGRVCGKRPDSALPWKKVCPKDTDSSTLVHPAWIQDFSSRI